MPYVRVENERRFWSVVKAWIVMVWQYARYVLRHKWYVFIECCRRGIPWRGLMHDISKFLPGEFMPYARYFYGPRDLTEQEGQGAQSAFDLAWLKHQKRNPHHWQYWALQEDNGGVKYLEMPDHYRKEMIADWIGAGQALGKPDLLEWYRIFSVRMKLNRDT